MPGAKQRGRPVRAYACPHNKQAKTQSRDFAGSVALPFDYDTVVEGDATRSASIDLALRAMDPIQLFAVFKNLCPLT